MVLPDGIKPLRRQPDPAAVTNCKKERTWKGAFPEVSVANPASASAFPVNRDPRAGFPEAAAEAPALQVLEALGQDRESFGNSAYLGLTRNTASAHSVTTDPRPSNQDEHVAPSRVLWSIRLFRDETASYPTVPVRSRANA